MSTFDPATFLTQRHTQGADTRVPLHNPGDWRGVVGTNTDPERGDITIRTIEYDDKDNPGSKLERQIAEINLYCDDDKAVPPGGLKPTRVRFSAFLDFNADGTLNWDKGMNRQLGNLLTAVGIQNKDGSMKVADWGWADLYGKPLMYRVAHKPRKDTGEPQANVTQVAPIV